MKSRDLRPGDLLDGLDGSITVQSVQSLPGIHRVYNMTVEGEHMYRVSSLGTLVHNTVKNRCAATPPGNRIPKPNKAVNTNLPHAVERGVEHGVFKTKAEATDALKDLSKQITKDGFPPNAILDTAHADRVLVPVGKNGLAVYQVGKNGTAKLKTVLIVR